jgi:hypothetical protein
MGAGKGRSGWRGGTYFFSICENAFALDCSFGPCSRKFDQRLSGSLGFRSASRTQGLLGILPKRIGL